MPSFKYYNFILFPMKINTQFLCRFSAIFIALFWQLNPAIGQSLSVLDTKNGFRDVRFETSISSEPGMKFSAVDKSLPNVKQYTRPADKLTLGQAELYDIIYSAYKGTFFRVRLEFDSSDAAKIFKALTEVYGEPTKSIPAPVGGNWSQYQWNGEKVTMIMNFTGLENWVTIVSNTLMDQIEKDRTKQISHDL